jgi:hypothetical protein
MLGVAHDAEGGERVRVAVRERGVEFPVLVDRRSALARQLGFRVVPSGFFVEDGIVRYAHTGDFDLGDPRVRYSLVEFLDGRPVPSPPVGQAARPEALALFASGADLHARGDVEGGLEHWRAALAIDPDNFLIRSQIWVVEHPEHFYPTVDRDWQARRLIEERYDGPLP